MPQHVGLSYTTRGCLQRAILTKLHLLYGKCLCWCRFAENAKCHTGILRRYAKASGGRSSRPRQTPSGAPRGRHRRRSRRVPVPTVIAAGSPEEMRRRKPRPYKPRRRRRRATPPPTQPRRLSTDRDDELPPPAQDVDALMVIPQMREDEEQDSIELV